MKKSPITFSVILLALVALYACNKEPGGNANATGVVFTMDNSPAGNHIIAFIHAANGLLSPAGSYATKGLGTGSGLGSQGSIVIYNGYLYVCNAGSNEISVFTVDAGGLTFVDKISSQGLMPVSLTVHNNLLYALNAGKIGSITGFKIKNNGHLVYITGADRPVGSGAEQIDFNPAGDQLVVTHKVDNIIYTFPVYSTGLPGTGTEHPSAGKTPFGFKFTTDNLLIVSEAFDGAAAQSAVSSYKLEANGSLQVITASAATHQTSACWIAVTNDGRYCYSANATSGTVSGYKINNSGALKLIDANGVTAVAGAGVTDMSMDKDSKFLYTLNTGAHTVSVFKVTSNGGLTSVGDVSGMPATAAGIAAW